MEWKLEVVPNPVSDIDRAKRFSSEHLGFTVDLDDKINADLRFVQLTPPSSACSIVIGKGISPSPPGATQGTQLLVSDPNGNGWVVLERPV